MKGLITYFSLTGNNKRIANKLAEEKKYEIVEFAPGNVLRVFYMLFKRGLDKKASRMSFKDYEDIIICGPVWAGKPAPPVQSLIKKARGKSIRLYLS